MYRFGATTSAARLITGLAMVILLSSTLGSPSTILARPYTTPSTVQHALAPLARTLSAPAVAAPQQCGTPQPGLFYRYDVIAKSGDADASGTINTLGTGPWVSDRGAIAFVEHRTNGNGIYACDASNGLRNVSPSLTVPQTIAGF